MNLIKRYRNKLIKGTILLFLIIMLIYSDASFRGASSGLLLWFHNIMPTLLPFIIISNLIIRLDISRLISKTLYPILGRFLRVSSEGCYPIVIGFLSGLPMGAKTSSDLVMEQSISQKEGQFLFTMCNNASPMFIIGYIALTQLKLPQIKYALFIILYGSSILGALLFRHFYERLKKKADISTPITPKRSSSVESNRFSFKMLDGSIMNGFEIVTKIGGYIILFSILAQIMKDVVPSTGLLKASFMGILEITTGINQICSLDIDIKTKIVLVSMLTSFGGLSGIAQTKSVLQDSRLSIYIYFQVKLISAVIALFLAMFYVTFFNI